MIKFCWGRFVEAWKNYTKAKKLDASCQDDKPSIYFNRKQVPTNLAVQCAIKPSYSVTCLPNCKYVVWMKYLFLFMLLSFLGVTHSNLLWNGFNNVEVMYGLYKVEEILVFLFYFYVYIFALLERWEIYSTNELTVPKYFVARDKELVMLRNEIKDC